MSAPAVAAPHVSWLKHVGQIIGKILHIVAKDASPLAHIAGPVVEALFPQFVAPVEAGLNLIDNIAKEAVAAEAVNSAIATPGTGVDKLNAVLASVGPAIDQWVAARFPGAGAVADAEKAGLVNAIVAIVNKLQPPPNVTA